MITLYAEEYYSFQIDQMYKDQNFLQEMMAYDYSCIREQVVVNEAKLGELVKNFFKWIIQKFNDMIVFIKKIFGKVYSQLTDKTKETQDITISIENILSNNKEKVFILKNQRFSELNFITYEDFVKSSDFKSCQNIDIAQRILDLYLDYDRNEEQIKINTPQFVQIVKTKGYRAACSNEIFNLKVINAYLKKMRNKQVDDHIDKEEMKKILYQTIFSSDQDKDTIEYKDITVNLQFITGCKLQIESINKCNGRVKNAISTNEKTMEISKKKIQNIEKRMNDSVITEEMFKSFKLFSEYFVKLFNYNRDILLYLSEISNFQLSYLNNMMKKIDQHLNSSTSAT